MTIDELEKAWNAEPRENAWEELGVDEIVAFAQEVERDRLNKWFKSILKMDIIYEELSDYKRTSPANITDVINAIYRLLD